MAPPQLPAAGFAVNTYSYTLEFPVRAALERLSALGFREFELVMYPGHLWPADIGRAERRELRALMADQGLGVRTLNMPNIDLNIAAATREMRAMTLGVLRGVVELAGDLGAEGVIIGTGKANPLFPMPKAQLVEYFNRALAELVPLADGAGSAIFVENMPFGFLPRADEMLEAIDQYGDPRVGVVYDVANGHFVGESIPDAIRLCGPRLVAVHLSDTGPAVYRHDEIGLGTVDFTPIPAALAEVGFRRKPILEIIGTDADGAIARSARRLAQIGWAHQGA